MSSTQEGSSGLSKKAKKTDKGRRVWLQSEEVILIASVKELIAQGWKSDNGYRAGYLSKLEEAMKVHFPSTDLRATPHINSKLSNWKKNYYSLTNIMGKSGVGFNVRGNHKIDCEDQTWELILKTDSNARGMRYKSWPYYDDWKIIYGKDRANGESAEDIYEAFDDIRSTFVETGQDDHENDYNVSLDDLEEQEEAAESNTTNQRRAQIPAKPSKKLKSTDAISSVCDILVEIGRKADARLASLAESLGYEASLGKALEDAFDELGAIPNLSEEDRFEVCAILGTQADKLKIFKGMRPTSRPQYISWLLAKNRD